jgi:chromosome condensin MukBEF complex kleisin-like MukF subunit
MAEIKYTKADALHEIMEAMADNANVVAYCENELALLESKKVKAKERADKKRAEGDELQAAIASVLTDAPQTRDDILAHFDDEELTVGKIQAKLNNLVKFGQASKCNIKTEDGKVRTGYTVFTGDAE